MSPGPTLPARKRVRFAPSSPAQDRVRRIQKNIET